MGSLKAKKLNTKKITRIGIFIIEEMLQKYNILEKKFYQAFDKLRVPLYLRYKNNLKCTNIKERKNNENREKNLKIFVEKMYNIHALIH